MGNGGMGCWYAVFCKPRQEAVAEENLQRQGFHVYLPRTRIRHRRRGQWVNAIEALFPRYVFILIDPFRRSTATVPRQRPHWPSNSRARRSPAAGRPRPTHRSQGIQRSWHRMNG